MQLVLLGIGHFVGFHSHKSAQVKKHHPKVSQLMMVVKMSKRTKMNSKNGFMLEQGLDIL